jgi:hypothetical protein
MSDATQNNAVILMMILRNTKGSEGFAFQQSRIINLLEKYAANFWLAT